MNWAAARSQHALADALTPLGLDPRRYGLIVVAATAPGATQQELAAFAQIDPSTLVELIDKLEAAGLAERRPHPDDRRKRAIYLTDRGEAALAEARVAVQRIGDELTRRLTDKERAELTRLVQKLTAPGADQALRT